MQLKEIIFSGFIFLGGCCSLVKDVNKVQYYKLSKEKDTPSKTYLHRLVYEWERKLASKGFYVNSKGHVEPTKLHLQTKGGKRFRVELDVDADYWDLKMKGFFLKIESEF